MDMLGMNIANSAMQMSQSRLQQDIGIAVLGKALDTTQQMGDLFNAEVMSASPAPVVTENMARPYLGGNFDMSV